MIRRADYTSTDLIPPQCFSGVSISHCPEGMFAQTTALGLFAFVNLGIHTHAIFVACLAPATGWIPNDVIACSFTRAARTSQLETQCAADHSASLSYI